MNNTDKSNTTSEKIADIGFGVILIVSSLFAFLFLNFMATDPKTLNVILGIGIPLAMIISGAWWIYESVKPKSDSNQQSTSQTHSVVRTFINILLLSLVLIIMVVYLVPLLFGEFPLYYFIYLLIVTIWCYKSFSDKTPSKMFTVLLSIASIGIALSLWRGDYRGGFFSVLMGIPLISFFVITSYLFEKK